MAKVIHDDDDDSDDTSLPGRPFLFFNRRKSFGIPAAGFQTLAKATLHYDDDDDDDAGSQTLAKATLHYDDDIIRGPRNVLASLFRNIQMRSNFFTLYLT